MTESVDWTVVNCTNSGSFVSLSNTVPVLVCPGSYQGLEITVCDSGHRMVQTVVNPGSIAPGQTYPVSVAWEPDENLLFYEGFDNFVWGGDIINGEGSTGYAPDSRKISAWNDAKDRDGYADAFTSVAYDYPGSAFIQTNTWNDVKSATVGTSHQLPDSYITSRNIADWTYLYRCQEYHGAIGVGLIVNRGVVQTPPMSRVGSVTDAVISFRYCLQDGCEDDLYLQLMYAGNVKSVKIDGSDAQYTSTYYSTASRNYISKDNVTIPASAAEKKQWHTCEITAENLTNATAIYLAGSTTTSGKVHGFYLDEIKVTAVPGTEKKGTLRILYWNIANGMWADQANNYNKFVEFVRRYDPDVCVWCEASTIYANNALTEVAVSNKYFPQGWSTVAPRYGHNYTSLGGVIGGNWQYPQVVTSKYPLTTIKKITTTNVSGKTITRGAGMHRLNYNGQNIDIVTVHMWPFSYANGVSSSQQSASTAENGGDKYRQFEIEYILEQTINNAEYASTTNWILVGDFNSASPLDIPIVSGSASDAKFLCQNAVLNNTDLKDAIKEAYNEGDFVASTYSEKDRKDYVYLSPALAGKMANAFVLNDDWTYVATIRTVSGTNMKTPSDHRPILVELQL